MTPHERLRMLHRTLDRASFIVPKGRREDWLAEWVAELSYVYGEDPAAASSLAQGLFHDAVAMRRLHLRECYRAIDWRSPRICLRLLFGIFASLSAIAMSQPHTRHLIFSGWGAATFAGFVVLAVFTVPSTVVVSRFGACDAYEGDAASTRQRASRWGFLSGKLILLVLSSYLLAVELVLPLHRLIDFADSFLIPFGMLFNVIAIGWAFNDQRERCPTCMRSLRGSARMGPPSWSLLDSNGTEEMCDRGHGLLHQPQWETSWFENARWLQLDNTWRELFRP